MKSKPQKKSIPKKDGMKANTSKSVTEPKHIYPWAVVADCILMLFFLFTDAWPLKPDKQLYFAIGTAVVFLITLLQKENRELLFNKISVIFVVLLAQCVLYFAGLFYGAYPKFALQQFFMNTGALLVFATAYMSFLRREINLDKILRLFTVMIVIASLVSIELATSGLLRGFFQTMADILKTQLPTYYGAFETNTRITTVLGNPNVFAPITVFGMFAALWSCGRHGERHQKTIFQMSFAVICGTTFILCFSLGTILVYIAMLIVYILTAANEDRGTQLFRHLYCIITALLGAGFVFALRQYSIAPLACVIILSLLAGYLYTLIKPFKLPLLSTKQKWTALAGIIVVCTVVIIGATALRGAYSMTQGSAFKRAVALKPGDYELTVSFGESQEAPAASVEISSMSYTEAALKERTILKTIQVHSGEAVVFTVPDASAAVFFNFTANTELVMTDAAISGASSALQLPLKYTILPEFIVNRLQGIWVNDNAIQRFIFFRDGIRLGLKSPVIGLGGGAFEGGLYSVADYYYQTKHAHNEFIERFAEGGILGFLLFAALAAAVLRALFKVRKSEKVKQLYPLLAGSMVMIFLHSMIEVDFLLPAFRIATSILLALVAAACGDLLVLRKKLNITVFSAFSVISLGLVMLAAGEYAANKLLDKNPTLQSLQTAIQLDPLNRNDYKLSYISNTSTETKPFVISIQNDYLDAMKNDVTGYDVRAQFYLQKSEPNVKEGVQAAENFVRENRVNTPAWNTVFSLYNTALDSMAGNRESAAVIAESIKNLCGYLSELNGTLPKKIMPDLAIYSFMRAEITQTKPDNAILLADSRITSDLNTDGAPDIIDSVTDNAIQWKMKVTLPGAYMIKTYQQASGTFEVSLDGNPLSGEYSSAEGCYIAFAYMILNPVSELTIKTGPDTDGVYFTIEKMN